MAELDRERVGAYFAAPRTVSEWWTPDEGPLAFHYEAELRVLDERVAPRADWRALDLGTGRGRFAVHVAERGCHVVALDVNPDMLEAARAAARARGVAERVEVRRGSAEDLSAFAPESFDLVLCMELFDHLPDLRAALGEARRVLAPGGRFVFSYVPSESLYGAIGNAYRRWRARRRPDDLMISRTYSLPEVRARLAAAGLRLEAFFGLGLLCLNAQTRLFSDSAPARALNALARFEAARRPYHAVPWLARHAAHVVGIARPDPGARP
jgi:2-polyprenyl-6-hydroxyphenyl methylase/3-demethylubiquinone-9 3-methyltransferase